MTDAQVRLEPDRDYDEDNPADYEQAQWRWVYNDATSPWFPSRAEAFADGSEKHPGVGIG